MNTPVDLLNDSPEAPRLPRELLEGRLALRITARLTEGAEALPHDISERLRFSRERAVAMAQHQRRLAAVAAPAVQVAGRGQAALAGGPPSWGLRLASVVPLVVLAIGLLLIQEHAQHEQIMAAAEIDSALLADDLPPDAYRDPGFLEYLRTHAEP